MSRLTKALSVVIVGNPQMAQFNSFRLVRGDIARSLAAYCGHGVYLDVALAWVVGRWATGPGDAPPRPGPPVRLHVPPAAGAFRAAAPARPGRGRSGSSPCWASCPSCFGAGLSLVIVWARLRHQIPVQGYTSLVVVICFFFGVVLFSLGIIAEYLAVTLTTGMGRPLYVTVSRPHRADSAAR